MINDVFDKIIECISTSMEGITQQKDCEKSLMMALNTLAVIGGIAGGAKSMAKLPEEENKIQ